MIIEARTHWVGCCNDYCHMWDDRGGHVCILL